MATRCQRRPWQSTGATGRTQTLHPAVAARSGSEGRGLPVMPLATELGPAIPAQAGTGTTCGVGSQADQASQRSRKHQQPPSVGRASGGTASDAERGCLVLAGAEHEAKNTCPAGNGTSQSVCQLVSVTSQAAIWGRCGLSSSIMPPGRCGAVPPHHRGQQSLACGCGCRLGLGDLGWEWCT